MTPAIAMLLYMLAAHAICDYPLQGDWLSKAKNPKFDLVPGETIWPMALMSHAIIHAAAVQLITGSWLLAVMEFMAHTAIDYGKCRGWFGYNMDQYLHVSCKVAYFVAIIVLGGTPQ